MECLIHNEMAIVKLTAKELLSASKTKASLSITLSDAVLEANKESKKKIVIVKGTAVQVNQSHTLKEPMSTHNQ